MNSNLVSFVLFSVDAAIVIFLGVLLIGYFQKRIFALGRWYYQATEKSQFWQVIIGYILLIIVLLYIRVVIFVLLFFQKDFFNTLSNDYGVIVNNFV